MPDDTQARTQILSSINMIQDALAVLESNVRLIRSMIMKVALDHANWQRNRIDAEPMRRRKR